MHDSFPWIQLFGHQARDEQKSWISVEGLVDLRKDSVLGQSVSSCNVVTIYGLTTSITPMK